MRVLVLALLLLPALAHADDDARTHFDRGASLYDATRYEAALHEFEDAYTIDPKSGLVYDIAKCLDKLDRKHEAAEAYQKFLALSTEETDESRQAQLRLSQIRAEELRLLPAPVPEPAKPLLVVGVSPAPARVPVRPSARSRFIGPSILGGGALVLGAIGAGLLGSSLTSYNDLSMACAPNCSPSMWSNLPPREHAGEALLGIAGAAAVADVIWFVVEAKRRK